MKKGSEEDKGIAKTLSELMTLMTARELSQGERDKLAEKREEKTNATLDTLINSVNTLTISHTESQRDSKEIFKAIERLDENQKEQGKKQSTHSEVLAVHEVKINSSKSVIREVGGVFIAIITAVVIGGLI